MTPALRIGGLQPLTTVDWPGRLAAVVFLQGCPWRCGYCHNPALLDPAAATPTDWNAVLDFLGRRRGLLDGVVFSGGEPTLQSGLPQALRTVRAMGFQVGLHTAGMVPDRLAALLPLLDWVGFDVKAPWDRYDAVTGVPGSGAKAKASLALLLASGVAHECRTTWHAGLFDDAALAALGGALATLGVTSWAVQRCRVPGGPQQTAALPSLGAVGERFARFVVR
jgi:pyruvate formate lyase activating enzyme